MAAFVKPLSVTGFALLLLAHNINAQHAGLTEFHPPTAEELSYKECPYDKEANAIILYHQAITSYTESYSMETYHYVRLKILKDKGVDYGTITIPYYKNDNFEFISGIKGNIYNGPQVISLDKKSIYQKDINKFYSEYRFTFPDVKAGSVIEYTYLSTMKHYGGLEEWVFQHDIPVQKSNYDLTLLPNSEFSYVVNKNPNLNIKIKPDPDNGKINFEMNYVPGLRDEPYMDSRKDYLQKVSFQLSKFQSIKYSDSWDKINDEMVSNQYFYRQLKKDLPGTEDFIKSLKQMSDDYEKMKAVYNFVRTSISWNNINSRVSIDGINYAWSKKTGTSGDINLILINLLKAAGIDAEPVLVSERYHGKVNPAFTFIDQFNTAYAVVNINNRYYYLDATEKYALPYLTPYYVLNTTGFIVRKKKGELVQITDTAVSYKQSILVNANFGANGELTGDFSIDNYDYARTREQYRYYNSGSSSYEKRITGGIPGISIDELKMEPDPNERKALKISGRFSLPSSNSSDYYFLPYNIFTGFTENPFTSDNRFSNINFGYRHSISFFIHIKLNEKFTVNELPRSLKLSNETKDIYFTRVVFEDKENNEIAIRGNIEITKGLYEFWQYNSIKDYYKKLFSYLSEQIVLKKKQ